MADPTPRRGSRVVTRKYTGVDDTTGQAVQLTNGAIEWLIYVYTTTTTTLVNSFKLKGANDAHTDTLDIVTNPLAMGLSVSGSATPFTIYAASGETVDIHIVGLV